MFLKIPVELTESFNSFCCWLKMLALNVAPDLTYCAIHSAKSPLQILVNVAIAG